MVDRQIDHIRRVYLVCERQKWCYLSIQKVAGTSIRIAFLKHVGVPFTEKDNLRETIKPWQLTQTEVLRRQDLFRWGFIRDPRDRLISCWKNKIGSEKPDPYCTWRVNKFWGYSFDAFVRAVCDMPYEEMDQHYAPQYFILTYRGLPLYDRLFLYDRLQQSWAILQQWYGLPDLPHINPSDKEESDTYFDKELESMVRNKYAMDFEILEDVKASSNE